MVLQVDDAQPKSAPATPASRRVPVKDAIAVHVVHGLEKLVHVHLDSILAHIVPSTPVHTGVQSAIYSQGQQPHGGRPTARRQADAPFRKMTAARKPIPILLLYAPVPLQLQMTRLMSS